LNYLETYASVAVLIKSVEHEMCIGASVCHVTQDISMHNIPQKSGIFNNERDVSGLLDSAHITIFRR